MKKGIFIISVLVGLFIQSFNTSCNSIGKNASALPTLKIRKDTSSQMEFLSIENEFKKHVAAIQKDSNNEASKLKLVEIYINESRVTGDLEYYNEAALKVLNDLLKKKDTKSDNRYQALTYKATVLLSLHQFNDAKLVAEEALKMNPYDADIYGALVDANVELGNYTMAEVMCDKMMTIRPDIRSYSRVSYLRQINGDNDGAKKAMRLAVESGVQGFENTEWARVQLGDLYLQTGHADTAKMLYESALFARPKYAYAEMGMAKMYHAIGDNTNAILHCKNAIRTLSESSFISYLGELTDADGNKKEADKIHQDVMDLMQENEKENQKNKNMKHNGNRELASAFLHVNNLDQALLFAMKDLEMRKNNIDANEMVAWIYFLKNEFANAKLHIDLAMKQNTQSAILFSKASMIYEGIGDLKMSTIFKSKSIALNKNMKGNAINF